MTSHFESNVNQKRYDIASQKWKSKSKLVPEIFAIFHKYLNTGEVLESLKSAKINKNMCLTANEGLNLPVK
jgi:hypothetical protein